MYDAPCSPPVCAIRVNVLLVRWTGEVSALYSRGVFPRRRRRPTCVWDTLAPLAEKCPRARLLFVRETMASSSNRSLFLGITGMDQSCRAPPALYPLYAPGKSFAIKPRTAPAPCANLRLYAPIHRTPQTRRAIYTNHGSPIMIATRLIGKNFILRKDEGTCNIIKGFPQSSLPPDFRNGIRK